MHVTVPIPLNVTWMVMKGWLVWSGLLYQCEWFIIPVCLNKQQETHNLLCTGYTHHRYNRKRLCVCIDIIYTGYPHHRDNNTQYLCPHILTVCSVGATHTQRTDSTEDPTETR